MESTPPSPFRLDPRAIPGNGMHLQGQTQPGFFGLPEGGEVIEGGPLHYDLRLDPDGSEVVVSGHLDTQFSLECGRCLERFPFEVEIPAWHHVAQPKDDQMIDLTDQVREDILLALPSYPRCEHGNIDQRDCPAEGQFEKVEPVTFDETGSSKQTAWDTLDDLI